VYSTILVVKYILAKEGTCPSTLFLLLVHPFSQFWSKFILQPAEEASLASFTFKKGLTNKNKG
jgi:hypothetical protein